MEINSRFSKYLITLLIILLNSNVNSQILFTQIPIDNQLVGRNKISNTGKVQIVGFAENSIISYDSLLIEVHRNEPIYENKIQALDYSLNIADFDFEFNIPAELANYSFHIFGILGEERTLVKTINNIVAGDTYIIQGQSNAEAPMVQGSANNYRDDFIRVYASGTHFKDSLPEDNNWYVGQGDGYRTSRGNTGQWGLKLAKMLIDSINIPIAIFNGAHGGKDINFYQCPEDYQTTLTSNYSRLYYRLNKSGLKDFVRAVLWSQGEWDGENYSNTALEEYKNLFNNLTEDWYRDYPNIEEIYIFQTKNGCGGFLHNIKEAQRQLAADNNNISIMSTAALAHFQDHCHFPFLDGYEIFANRIFPLVTRDLYNINTNNEVDAPMITYANLVNDLTLIVGTDSEELSITNIAEDFYLSSNTLSEITNIQISNEKIVFSLSEHPGQYSTISYLAQDSGVGNFITNSKNLELICFYNYPIIETSSNNEIIHYKPIIYPNPTNDLIKVKLPYFVANNEITLFDIYGKIIFNRFESKNEIMINLPEIDGMYILELKDEYGNISRHKIIKR